MNTDDGEEMTVMKRSFIIFIIIATIASCAVCTKAYELLSPDHPEINQNMKDYYAAEAIATAQGEFFEAKLLQCIKLKAFDTTYYHYWVVIAPRTDLPLNLLNVSFLPPPTLSQYFLKDYPHASNELMQGSTPNLNPYDAMRSVDKLWPIEYRFTWTNYGDDLQQTAGIADEVFDEQMRTLRLEVQFNGRIEALTLTPDAFAVVVDESDPFAADDAFLQAVLHEGVCLAGRNPFRTTYE
jgi:hypothetical protein